jgi:hypothetical protein
MQNVFMKPTTSYAILSSSGEKLAVALVSELKLLLVNWKQEHFLAHDKSKPLKIVTKMQRTVSIGCGEQRQPEN